MLYQTVMAKKLQACEEKCLRYEKEIAQLNFELQIERKQAIADAEKREYIRKAYENNLAALEERIEELDILLNAANQLKDLYEERADLLKANEKRLKRVIYDKYFSNIEYENLKKLSKGQLIEIISKANLCKSLFGDGALLTDEDSDSACETREYVLDELTSRRYMSMDGTTYYSNIDVVYGLD